MKDFFGRPINSSILFEPKGTFEAINEARNYLKERGYTLGSMERDNPIGFADAERVGYISKWTNMTSAEQKQVDGVIILYKGDFRDGGAEILFFEEPKEPK